MPSQYNSPIFLKTKDSNYELELGIRYQRYTSRSGRVSSQLFTAWFVEYRKVWPSEDGVYETPQLTLVYNDISRIWDIANEYADCRDMATNQAVSKLAKGEWPSSRFT